MFKVTILKMKDIIKWIIGLGIISILIILVTSKVSNEKEDKSITMIDCFEKTMPVAKELNEEYKKISEEDDKKENSNIYEEILKTQLSSIKAIEEIEKNENDTEGEQKEKEEISNNNNDSVNNVNVEKETVLENVETKVVTNNPITESYNVQYGKVKIKNQTTYELTQEMLTPNITIENKNILLFHTHSCESYTSSEQYPYNPTGNFRTTDLNFTVTRLGTELETYLKQYNYNVMHNTSYHDYPAYNGSYTRSLATVENVLKETPSDIIIDIHRDAVGSRSDYAPAVQIGNEVAAQIMFVVGTNEGGLWHPNWNQNLKFAVKVQEKAEELYPGLFKPIMLTKSRYNQHTGKYATIMEVGATGNTLEQCITSMKYLAKIMSQVI